MKTPIVLLLVLQVGTLQFSAADVVLRTKVSFDSNLNLVGEFVMSILFITDTESYIINNANIVRVEICSSSKGIQIPSVISDGPTKNSMLAKFVVRIPGEYVFHIKVNAMEVGVVTQTYFPRMDVLTKTVNPYLLCQSGIQYQYIIRARDWFESTSELNNDKWAFIAKPVGNVHLDGEVSWKLLLLDSGDILLKLIVEEPMYFILTLTYQKVEVKGALFHCYCWTKQEYGNLKKQIENDTIHNYQGMLVEGRDEKDMKKKSIILLISRERVTIKESLEGETLENFNFSTSTFIHDLNDTSTTLILIAVGRDRQLTMEFDFAVARFLLATVAVHKELNTNF